MHFPLALQQHSLQRSETEVLRVSEIFFSLQGETSRVGLPTIFIRLSGCPLRCNYCDTEYAFAGGRNMAIVDVLNEISPFASRYITVTGGEPLAQKACLKLLTQLCEAGYSVSIETSGALDISKVDSRVSKIVDIKTPGSGEVAKNLWANLDYLTFHDELKFVLCNEVDYRWAVNVVHERCLDQICPVLFSPVYGQLDPVMLAEWILKDRLPVRFQLQIHKILWGETKGR